MKPFSFSSLLAILFVLTSCSQSTYKVIREHENRDFVPKPEFGDYYNSKTSIFMVTPDYENEIVFLGDSITDWADWGELFPNKTIMNRGIGGDRLPGLIYRIEEVTESQPKKIFIMIGTNDLAIGDSPETILSNYRTLIALIKEQSPNTTVFIQSVFPVKGHSNRPTADLMAINTGLQEIAKENQIQYIDIFNLLKDENNELKQEYTYDGLHVHGKGYEIWKAAIEKYVNN